MDQSDIAWGADHPPSVAQTQIAGHGAWHVWPAGQTHPPLVPVIEQAHRRLP